MRIIYYDREVHTQKMLEEISELGAMMKEYYTGDIEALLFTIHEQQKTIKSLTDKNDGLTSEIFCLNKNDLKDFEEIKKCQTCKSDDTNLCYNCDDLDYYVPDGTQYIAYLKGKVKILKAKALLFYKWNYAGDKNFLIKDFEKEIKK